MRRKFNLVSIGILLIISALIISCGDMTKKKEEAKQKEDTDKTEPVKAKKKAPMFTLEKINGTGLLDFADYAGKVVLIDFWATWCPPCRASIPNLNRLYGEYNGHGFEIIGVSVDRIQTQKDLDKVKNFIRRFKMEYPIVLVSQDMRQSYGGVSSIPTMLIIDREGMIITKYTGYSPAIEKQMEEIIKKLL